MSDLYQSLAHSKWDCKYHVVFVPKRRRKAIFGQIRRQLGGVFHSLAKQKECQIVEGHLMPDHVHMCIAIPPEAPGRLGDWVSEREECHCHRTAVRKGEKLLWRTLLGPRLRGVHGGVRTGAGAPIHPRAGRRGW
jgi:REP element-mobilizing transposase RayT